jgi:hypothetical protein
VLSACGIRAAGADLRRVMADRNGHLAGIHHRAERAPASARDSG